MVEKSRSSIFWVGVIEDIQLKDSSFTIMWSLGREKHFQIAMKVGQLATVCIMLMKDIIFPDPLHLLGLNLWIAIIALFPSHFNQYINYPVTNYAIPTKSLHCALDAF